MLTYHSANPRALKNNAPSTLPALYKWNNKVWMTVHLFTTGPTEYLKPTVETYSSEKKILFKILLFTDSVPGHPKALMKMYKIKVAFAPANNTTPLLQPKDQRLILTFKSYYLRKTFCKVIAAVVTSLMDLGKETCKPSRKDASN